ncbi:MAG: hypothetical protein ACJ76S_11445 [Solirubrobacteraceae bacterium]
MVRRPAAVLTAVYGAALALFLLAPVLPPVGGTRDLNTAVSDVPAMLLLGGCVLTLLPARNAPLGLALLVLGAGLLGAAFTVIGADPVANLGKALFAGSLGLLLAWLLAEPVVVVAVPVFAAALDIFSVTGGPTELLARDSSRAGDFLSLYLPAWGGGRAGALGVADLVFVGFFASSAWRFGLRRRTTAVALLAALPASLALQLFTKGTFPVLPVLAAALLVPNLDLLPRLLRSAGDR